MMSSPDAQFQQIHSIKASPTYDVGSPSVSPPRLDITSIDLAPFSDSFSGMLDEYPSFAEDNTSHILPKGVDLSYNIDRITDIKELDSQWLDSDVDEILIMSRKPSEKLSTIVEDASEFGVSSPVSENEREDEEEDMMRPRQSLPRTLQDFDIIDVGPGLAFGSTLCRRRDTTKLYEMRRYPARDVQERKQQRILEIISQLRSPFLPHVHSAFRENGDFHYVLDWHAGPSLTTLVSSSGPIEGGRAALFSSEIVDALHHLHGAKILHRCLSPDCVILTALGHIILTDFGRASFLIASPASSEPLGYATSNCRAPELNLGWKHEYAVDCWGLGVVLFYMLTAKLPLRSLHVNLEIAESLEQIKFQLPQHDNYALAGDLIEQCLELNPILRFNISQIRAHPYFSEVDWKGLAQDARNVPLLLQPPQITERVTCPSSARRVDNNQDNLFSPMQNQYETETRGSSMDGPADTLPEVFQMSSLLDEFPQVGQVPAVSFPTRQARTPPRSLAPQIDATSDIMEIPTSQVMTSEEKMAKFWESLDAEADEGPTESKPLSYAEAIATYCSKPLLRKPKSVNALGQKRLSTGSLTTMPTSSQGNLRKRFLSRPRSRPLSFKMTKQYDAPELPKGVEQIGNGIGFIRDKHTATVEDRISGEISADCSTPTIASCSKASVCALPNRTPKLAHQRGRYSSFLKSLPQLNLGFANPWRRGKLYGSQDPSVMAGQQQRHFEEAKVPKFKSRSKFRSFSGPAPCALSFASTTDLGASCHALGEKEKKSIRNRQSMPILSEGTSNDSNHDPASFIRQIYGSNSNLSLGLLMSPSSTIVVSPSMALSPLTDAGPLSPDLDTAGSRVTACGQESEGVVVIGEPRTSGDTEHEHDQGISILAIPRGPAKEAKEGDPQSTLRLVKPTRTQGLRL